jgi:hypothetical protein
MKSFQSGEKYEDFSKWSCCNGRPAWVKSFEKYKDFSKWCCNGRPARVKNEKSFQNGEKMKIFQSGLVVMVTCPGEKF